MRNGLTIGIPAYNEESCIEAAIRSTAPQCERLIVADNASTDATERVCRNLLPEYPNMEYWRHAENRGARGNWEFILERTSTPFVMFVGSHDYIDADFVEQVLPAIKEDPTVEIATGAYSFVYRNRTEEARAYNEWMEGENERPFDRLWHFVFDMAPLTWASYGIFRTERCREFFRRDLPVYCIDVAFICRVLARGKLRIVRSTSYHGFIREQADAPTDYVERIVGRKADPKQTGGLRKEFLASLLGTLLSVHESPDLFNMIRIRFALMVRFGIFKVPGIDPLLYLLYVPVKVKRRLDRFKRRWPEYVRWLRKAFGAPRATTGTDG